MGTLDLEGLPEGALLLVDAAPLIYVIEAHPKWRPRFRPVFEAHDAGRFRLAISTTVIAEVLTGPLRNGDEALARRYHSALQSWQVVDLDLAIAESAARLRASLRLKLPDAIQAASALAVNAAALVTHDRDFSRLRSLRVIS
jgi:predicted nucleic acid-binding protein